MIIRYVLRNYVDQIIAVSDALKQALEDNGIGNVEVIHNGIDTEEWRVSSEALAVFKKKHGLGDSVVVFGGRLTGIKGGHKLLEALSKVVHTIPDTQLLIIGKEGTYTEKMRKESARFGLDGKVFFTGWIVGQELHTAYHASAIVVVPSLCFDSFPTMNLEGMACKKPIIATCFGGSRELVINNKTGYIINPYNVAILGDKITGLLENKIKNTEFGAAGYERVLQAFSLKAQVEGYEKIFKKYT
jgi:glycosyltransferase involved in cell wall biosynthesis